MPRGTHGEKIVSAISNDKLPPIDIPRLENALNRYDAWISNLNSVTGKDLDDLITKLVDLLNEYKMFIDVELIFDSPEDFLYRQKGQLKLDNTVMEEFLPIFISRCLDFLGYDISALNIGSQTPTYSSMYFQSSLSSPEKGGGIVSRLKTKTFQ